SASANSKPTAETTGRIMEVAPDKGAAPASDQGAPRQQRKHANPSFVGAVGAKRQAARSAHALAELLEEITAVVGPRRRLGVILDAEQRPVAMAHSLQRAVVQIDVC